MKKVLHRAASRGHFDHGWLDTHHTFSFADYYDPERINFGKLRVINDDTVIGGEGFGPHPHQNMEIVSIPLEGGLEHGDSMGNRGVIRPGQIQVMSAGTGVYHSEFNASETAPVKFLQIWVFSDRDSHEPRYKDITLADARPNELQPIVSPEKEADANTGWLHQQTWFYLAELDKGRTVEHTLHANNHGVYIFVLDGSVEAEGETLGPRDGLGLWETGSVSLTATQNARVLLIEVPM